MLGYHYCSACGTSYRTAQGANECNRRCLYPDVKSKILQVMKDRMDKLRTKQDKYRSVEPDSFLVLDALGHKITALSEMVTLLEHTDYEDI